MTPHASKAENLQKKQKKRGGQQGADADGNRPIHRFNHRHSKSKRSSKRKRHPETKAKTASNSYSSRNSEDSISSQTDSMLGSKAFPIAIDDTENAHIPKPVLQEESQATLSTPTIQINWEMNEEYVPVAFEQHMLEILLARGKKERAMICNQPSFRYKQIREKLKETPGFKIEQALSLRRHHIVRLNPNRPMYALALGQTNDIRMSADIFERAVEELLEIKGIPYYNEKQQQKLPGKNRSRLTPDFLLPQAVLLKIWRYGSDGSERILGERSVHWIEAKMFYGASTIEEGTPGAVGSLLPKIRRYVQAFGPGAIVFMQGCGDKLANQLADAGVAALSSSELPKRLMKKVLQHQQTWCADRHGRILP